VSSQNLQMIEPPRPLSKKVGKGKGMDLRVLGKAEKAVETMLANTNYPDQVSGTLVKLKTVLDRALADNAGRDQHIHHLFEIVHDMRVEAGSFGYPLVTRVGASLCRYIDKVDPIDDEKNLRVVRVHVDALRALVRNNVKGTGSRVAQEIAQSLETVVQIHVEQQDQNQTGADAPGGNGFTTDLFRQR